MRDVEKYKAAMFMSDVFYTLGKAHALLAQAIALTDGTQAELARLTAIEFMEEARVMLNSDVAKSMFAEVVTFEVNDAIGYARRMKHEG